MNEDFIAPPSEIRRLALGLASNGIACGEWQLLPVGMALRGDNETRPAGRSEERAEMKEWNRRIRECACEVATAARTRRKSPASVRPHELARASADWKRALMMSIQPGSLA